MTPSVLGNNEIRTRLTQRLSQCQEVQQLDDKVPGETAASLAYCLHSLEDHFRRFLDEELPSLIETTDEQETRRVLHAIGANLGQILWHVDIAKFYAYLKER